MVENKNFYQDFTNTGTVPNVFEAGISNGSTIEYGQRMETVDDDIYKIDVVAPLVNNGKDFFIFPLDEAFNPDSNVERFEVRSIENAVVRNNNGQFSSNQRIFFTVGEQIFQSTFIAGGVVTSSSSLSKVTAIDLSLIHI